MSFDDITQVESEEREEKETGRVEAFSDGVFAIAITLLILEITVPHDAKSGEQLARELFALWPSYLAYLTSFATIGVMWMNHHRLFTYVRRVDHGLLFYNTLLLLVVSFVPFPTAVMADYLAHDQSGTSNVAAMLYSATGLVLAIFYNLLWRHIAYWGKLLSKNTPPAFVEGINSSYKFGPLLYAVALALALFSGLVSFVFNMALALFFALPSRLNR